ncbi:hypothetical protein HHX47_DHR6000518 [Lentinula edodes]|nr:hypothetical protein HHX47_DHR6000518 [Lentinula edodes]
MTVIGGNQYSPSSPQLLRRSHADIDIAGLTIAIVITFTRLGIRIKNRKLGWDDFWATFSIIGAALLMTGVLIILDPKRRHFRGAASFTSS